ncbi:MAG: hypothetical protein J0I06_02140 [Planctomycetes bacterium]|nr:hypothetical protein [Planctomycetota bacterium]
MSRRAIPFVFAVAVFSYGAFSHHWATIACAAPVPPTPKPDDSASASARKLLQNRKIQKELKMSAEQRIVILDGLADIEEEHEKKLTELARMPNPSEEDYDKLDKARQKRTDKLLADAAAKTLTAPQRTRLRELHRRLLGPIAFTDAQVEKRLQLTDAQKKKAAVIAEQMKAEVERYLDGDGDENEAKRKADLFSFRKARLKEMEDALTADQKTAWDGLLGAAPTGFLVDELWLKIEEETDLLGPPG